jgi:DNA repair protein SbcC/Rad50
MQPLQLTLKGFRGIRDGLGRDEITLDLDQLAGNAQLIAIAGPNGRGKTTIMDNCTPYNLMPSRAGADGLGSFSYYDHVYLPENLKELIWAYEGKRYRSQVVIRVNGKRKTEAYLHVEQDGQWAPVVLPDATVSDGKIDTYERCVEHLLGKPETFFTSVFSAQGKRQLSAYKNGEIKTLLADLLGLEEIRALGARANDTLRLTKAGLASARTAMQSVESEIAQLHSRRLTLGDVSGKTQMAQRARAGAQAAVETVKALLAKRVAAKEAAAGAELQRRQLIEERKAAQATGTGLLLTLDEQAQREAQRLAALEASVKARMEARAKRVAELERARTRCQDALRLAPAVLRAQKTLPVAAHVLQMRESAVAAMRQTVEQLHACNAAEKLQRERLASIEQRVGQAVLRVRDLTRRFNLVTEVPCVGTALQQQCKLLSDANEASSLRPSAETEIARLEAEKSTIADQLKLLAAQTETLAAAPAALKRAEGKTKRARERLTARQSLAARGHEMAQASEGLSGIETQLRTINEPAATDQEDLVQRDAITKARAELASERNRQAQQLSQRLEQFDALLAKLPPPFDERQIAQAQAAVGAAQESAAASEQQVVQAARNEQSAIEIDARLQVLAAQGGSAKVRTQRIEQAITIWTLLAKALSNDGVIALSIDDAGPSLAALANDLLLACYGPRFSVSIHTLVDTAKGEAREGFDILVHDADTGQSKSVTLMSGGERVWVNEALTRAIALYLAQNSGRRYETLFCDEADGPLDPQRKREFMAMKREVLRLGGYRREFFVSQTPELQRMADMVIALDRLVASEKSGEPIDG